MFGSNKNQHTPASERKIGLTALKYYVFGFFAAVIYVYLFSINPVLKNFKIIYMLFDPDVAPNFVKETVNSVNLTEFPDYDKQPNYGLLNFKQDNIFYRPVFAEKTQKVIKSWEKRNGKKWQEHPSFKAYNPAIDTSKWYVSMDYNDPEYKRLKNKRTKIFETAKTDNTLSTEDLLKILSVGRNAVNDYERQWEAEYRRKNPKYIDIPMFSEIPNPDIIRTFTDDNLKDGECYSFDEPYEPFKHKIHNCDNANNKDYKRIIQKIYNADYFLHWRSIPITEEDWTNIYEFWEESNAWDTFVLTTEQGKKYLKELLDGESKNPGRVVDQPEYAALIKAAETRFQSQLISLNINNRPLSIPEIEAIRNSAFFSATLLIFLYLLIGNKYGVIKTPSFFSRHLYLFALPFFALYGATFYFRPASVSPSLVTVSWAIVPPFLFVTLPTLRLGIHEYFKEHSFYRRVVIWGRGGEASRLAGLKEFIAKDMGNFFLRNRGRIQREKTSKIYLGKTYFETDLKIGGRHIGMVDSEQHMITFAETGAGKSRDAVWNTLLSYSGGLVAFDPKGEHVRITYKRRAKYAPVHVLDPFGVVSDIVQTSYWNPLEEINPESLSARDELKNLAEASIFMDKHEGGTNPHFSDNAQIIYRGFLAYVVCTFPLKERADSK